MVSSIEHPLKRKHKPSVYDRISFPLLLTALGIAALEAANSINENPESFSPVTLLTFLSFILFTFRILIGDSNYNKITQALGISEVKSHAPFLENKKTVSGICLIIQSLLFIYLATCISESCDYLLGFYVVIMFNTIWLGYEARCLNRILNCKSFKQLNESEETEKDDEKRFTLKQFRRSKLQGVVIVWIFNNLLFGAIAVSCFNMAHNGTEGTIIAGVIASIVNSVVDFKLTYPFYHRPYEFIEDISKQF